VKSKTNEKIKEKKNICGIFHPTSNSERDRFPLSLSVSLLLESFTGLFLSLSS